MEGRATHFTVRNRCNLPRRAHQLASAYYPRQESFASLHILTRRASEGSEALPSLARRVRMSFFGARVIRKIAVKVINHYDEVLKVYKV
jgi:hypothetical protein